MEDGEVQEAPTEEEKDTAMLVDVSKQMATAGGEVKKKKSNTKPETIKEKIVKKLT